MYTNEELEQIAKNVRRGIIEQVYNAKSGHPGGALSCADILTTLYFNLANVDPASPEKKTGIELYCPKDMRQQHCILCWHIEDFLRWRS